MRALLILWLIAIQAGCLREASERCGNGSLCPPGQQCVDPGIASVERICVAGTCGNGRLDPGEACDDGNNRSGDGCPADCVAACGDGALDPGEVCDDGNVADGDGCAADCRALDGLSLISPASIELRADEGGALPDAITITVRPPSRGDLVQVGPSVPAWLSIASGPTTPSSAVFVLRAIDTSVAGERTAILQLTIQHAGAAALDTFDLPVAYRVEASDLAVHATPASLTFTATEGDPDIASQVIDVTANGDDLALESAPPWLIVTATSPASFVASIDDPSPIVWTELSGEAVFVAGRGAVQRRVSVHVDYRVLPDPPLAISAAPDELAFSAVSGAAASPPQVVAVSYTGDSVEVLEAPPWLTVTAPVSGSPAMFAVAPSTTAFAGGTVLHGQIRFGTTRDGAQDTTTIAVSYTLRYPPELLFVAPYLGTAQRGGSIYVRGRGLQIGRPITIRIGELTFGPITPDNDTQLTLSYPALPAGRYPVTLVDPAVVSPRAPELVIVAAPAYAYAALDASGSPNRLVYDAERQVLYSASVSEQRIRRFRFAGGAWTEQPALAVPRLADIALAPDGRSLIIVDQDRISEMSLTDGLDLPIERVHQPETTFCHAFTRVAPANNGKLLVLSVIPTGSGFCPSYFYDLVDHTLVRQSETFYFGLAAASADGRWLFAGDGSDPLRIYDMATGTSVAPVSARASFAISASRDASRVIVDDALVYSRTLRFTGNLPRPGPFATRASRDGSRAFVFPYDAQHPRLEIYDLQGPLQTGALYPLLATIPVPDVINDFNGYAMVMTSTPDDSAIFVAGAYKLLVIPVN